MMKHDVLAIMHMEKYTFKKRKLASVLSFISVDLQHKSRLVAC